MGHIRSDQTPFDKINSAFKDALIEAPALDPDKNSDYQ